MTLERLRDVVQELLAAADEIKKMGKDADGQAYGQLLAYAEALSIIRDACDPDDLETVGLAFDIDKRYL